MSAYSPSRSFWLRLRKLSYSAQSLRYFSFSAWMSFSAVSFISASFLLSFFCFFPLQLLVACSHLLIQCLYLREYLTQTADQKSNHTETLIKLCIS